MGRPDLTEQRTAEILDAFARCVARQGLGATSMQDIADEAGMKRPILRHYVGNRAELVTALAHHVAARYTRDVDALAEALPARGGADTLIRWILPARSEMTASEILVFESLIAAAQEDESVREPLLAYVDHVVEVFLGVLAAECPDATRAQCRDAAYGIVSIWFNFASLDALSPPAWHQRAARAAARAQVEALKLRGAQGS